MNDHDHAVVIGIGRYADVAAQPPWVGNLNGPVNDATAIAEWLRDPGGGGLPDDHVQVVLSEPEPDPFPAGGGAPAQQEVRDALESVTAMPTNAHRGRYSGRRFYLYVSGHGWASRRNEAAVVTAEATSANRLNVLASDWMEWLWYADRFEELVLWADACATRTAVDVLHGRKIDRFAQRPNALRFDAFAAQFNLLSAEREMPNGEWHGAFTYALLQALHGATGGPVTTTSVRNYLTNNMQAFLRDDQRIATISQEPDFGRTDEMEIADPPAPRTYPVTLRFRADCVGHTATISSTASHPAAAEQLLDATEWQPSLHAGAYVVSVPDLDLMSSFVVVGGGVDVPVTVP